MIRRRRAVAVVLEITKRYPLVVLTRVAMPGAKWCGHELPEDWQLLP